MGFTAFGFVDFICNNKTELGLYTFTYNGVDLCGFLLDETNRRADCITDKGDILRFPSSVNVFVFEGGEISREQIEKVVVARRVVRRACPTGLFCGWF
jgi:hypothetical protein